jgi:hypothetical protein
MKTELLKEAIKKEIRKILNEEEDSIIRNIAQKFEDDPNVPEGTENNPIPYETLEKYIKQKLSGEELKYLRPITNLVMAGNFW